MFSKIKILRLVRLITGLMIYSCIAQQDPTLLERYQNNEIKSAIAGDITANLILGFADTLKLSSQSEQDYYVSRFGKQRIKSEILSTNLNIASNIQKKRYQIFLKQDVPQLVKAIKNRDILKQDQIFNKLKEFDLKFNNYNEDKLTDVAFQKVYAYQNNIKTGLFFFNLADFGSSMYFNNLPLSKRILKWLGIRAITNAVNNHLNETNISIDQLLQNQLNQNQVKEKALYDLLNLKWNAINMGINISGKNLNDIVQAHGPGIKDDLKKQKRSLNNFTILKNKLTIYPISMLFEHMINKYQLFPKVTKSPITPFAMWITELAFINPKLDSVIPSYAIIRNLITSDSLRSCWGMHEQLVLNKVNALENADKVFKPLLDL